VEIAGDADVRTIGCASDAMERLLEEKGGGNSLCEGYCLVAQFGFGVDKNGLVDQILAEEATVEVRAALKENAQDVATGECGENGGEA
jgi:hypothetical protein